MTWLGRVGNRNAPPMLLYYNEGDRVVVASEADGQAYPAKVGACAVGTRRGAMIAH
jgi:hypothetical protein